MYDVPSVTGGGRNVVRIDKYLLKNKLNHTTNHSWSHEQYIQYCVKRIFLHSKCGILYV